ncbi:hypothetical protein [Geothrix sp. 21YS21S-2]|uniref:hypothetical protein n=1 Tax=Geothrix sp. 21YS21S-2 TaxID=3068893 RepID=UPI0027B93BAA|nr:hypothetical protein [Geothrix sp. 21YS21S-2]
MILHLIRTFVQAGSRHFILCCGYQMDLYSTLFATVGKGDGLHFELAGPGLEGTVDLVDTGLATPTAERVKQVQPLLRDVPWFWVTYSDTLSHVKLGELARFHLDHGLIATCLAARLPTRFRILGMKRGENLLRGFSDNPVIQNDYINGGFYAFRQELFNPAYLGNPASKVLEDAVLGELVKDGQMMAFPYEGPWHYLDCERDLGYLEALLAAKDNG